MRRTSRAVRLAGLGLVAVVLAAFGGIASAPADPAVAGVATTVAHQFSSETVPCPRKPSSEGEVEGQTYDCGVVVVPENHARPDGRTIELAYLRLRSTSANPAPDPVIYLSGGPGGSGLRDAANPLISRTMEALRASRDVVFYDQRGTGYSNLITCAPIQAGIGVVELRQPDLAPTIEAASQQVLLFGACAAVYVGEGVELAQYNSVSSARDIAAVADALGYTGRYNLYGTSYGTELAQNAMRTTPDRVRSVVLDGVVPPLVDGIADTVSGRVQPYKNIFALCAADAACDAAYPDLDRRFAALLTRLQSDPIVIDPPLQVKQDYIPFLGARIDSITPRFFVGLAKLNNDFANGGFAPATPRLIDDFERGDTAFLASFVAETAAPDPATLTPVQTVPTGDDVIKPDNQFLAAPIQVLLAFAEAAAKDPDPASLSNAWVLQVVTELRRRLLAGEPQADVIEAFVSWALLPVAGPDPGALRAYAAEYLTPATAAAADALVARMTRQDVRQTMWAIGDVAAVLGGGNSERNLTPGIFFAINCAEEAQFDTPETVQRYIDASPYPGLFLTSAEEFAASFGLICTYFPPSAVGPGVQDPVVSDIPALLFIEWMDTQTPRTWGLAAAETLRNSFVVEWTSEGHVIAGRSPDGCAGAIAAAFLNDPTRAPDASCSRAAYYTITFVLPGQTFPVMP